MRYCGCPTSSAGRPPFSGLQKSEKLQTCNPIMLLFCLRNVKMTPIIDAPKCMFFFFLFYSRSFSGWGRWRRRKWWLLHEPQRLFRPEQQQQLQHWRQQQSPSCGRGSALDVDRRVCPAQAQLQLRLHCIYGSHGFCPWDLDRRGPGCPYGLVVLLMLIRQILKQAESATWSKCLHSHLGVAG